MLRITKALRSANAPRSADALRPAQPWYYHPARQNDKNGLTLPQIRTAPFGGQGGNGELIAEIKGRTLVLEKGDELETGGDQPKTSEHLPPGHLPDDKSEDFTP